MPSLGSAIRAAAVNLHSVGVLQRAGVIDLLAPARTVRTARAVRHYGALSGPVHSAARREPDRVAVIDERGALTYRDLDLRSNALARGLVARGIGPGSTSPPWSRTVANSSTPCSPPARSVRGWCCSIPDSPHRNWPMSRRAKG